MRLADQKDDKALALSSARVLMDTSAADVAPEFAKALVQMIPGIGSLAAFAIDQRPATQLKRVVDYLRLLDELVEGMREAIDTLQGEWALRPEAANLFEMGMASASRAITHDRRRRLALVVAEGLRRDEAAALSAARRLRVLDQIDDGEFAVLVVLVRERRVTVEYGGDFDWKEDGSVTFLSTEGHAKPPPLPTELTGWPIDDLSLALNRLSGHGLAEANDSRTEAGAGARRSYAVTPAGVRLVESCRD
jgi:hypothetical protein